MAQEKSQAQSEARRATDGGPSATGLTSESTEQMLRHLYDLNARSLDRLQRMQGGMAQLVNRRAERYASLGQLNATGDLAERPFAAEQTWVEGMMSDYLEANRTFAALMDEQWRDALELGRTAFGPMMPPKV